jgi:hypothetical protein
MRSMITACRYGWFCLPIDFRLEMHGHLAVIRTHFFHRGRFCTVSPPRRGGKSIRHVTSYHSHVIHRDRPAERAILQLLPDALARSGSHKMAKVELRQERSGPRVDALSSFRSGDSPGGSLQTPPSRSVSGLPVIRQPSGSWRSPVWGCGQNQSGEYGAS